MLNVEQRAEEQPSAEWLIYEQPLNERVRIFLRLEFLLEQAAHHAALSSIWDSRAAVGSVLEIVSLLTRGDVRTEVLKELERCGILLQRLKGSPEVDNARLQTVLADLERRYPGVRFRMIDEQQRIRPHIRIFVAAREARDLQQPVAPGERVHLLCALSGG